MQIQNIGAYNNNIYNNPKYNKAPSFQHLKIVSEEHWDKDILAAVLNNKEIRNFEKYLEERNSVLELTTSHDYAPYNGLKETTYSIMATFARKFKIMGVDAEVTPMADKEHTLENLKKFKCDKLIDKFKAEEKIYNKNFHPDKAQKRRMQYIDNEMRRKSLMEHLVDLFF